MDTRESLIARSERGRQALNKYYGGVRDDWEQKNKLRRAQILEFLGMTEVKGKTFSISEVFCNTGIPAEYLLQKLSSWTRWGYVSKLPGLGRLRYQIGKRGRANLRWFKINMPITLSHASWMNEQWRMKINTLELTDNFTIREVEAKMFEKYGINCANPDEMPDVMPVPERLPVKKGEHFDPGSTYFNPGLSRRDWALQQQLYNSWNLDDDDS